MSTGARAASGQRDPRIRLLCFAHAGGNAAIFKRWAAQIANVEVVAMQMPGHGSRLKEPVLTDICAIALAFLSVAADGEAPTALFGHSMGALVAFELARLMERAGQPPLSLFVSAFRGPHLRDRGPPLHRLPDEELLTEVAAMNGTPPEILADAELMELYLPAIRADFSACETYVYKPSPPLTCPIWGLGGRSDDEVTREELLAWHTHTTEPFVLDMFEGGHFFVQTACDEVLKHVRAKLERAAFSRVLAPGGEASW